jgi:hypothetical protein
MATTKQPAANTAVNTENAALKKAENAALKAENAALKQDADALREELAELRAETGRTDKKEDYIDAVMVTPEGAEPMKDLIFKGKPCKKYVDAHGFTHFRVPRVHAADTLLYDGAGPKFFLTGQRSPVKAMVWKGLTQEQAEILPYAYDGKEWKPVKNGDA